MSVEETLAVAVTAYERQNRNLSRALRVIEKLVDSAVTVGGEVDTRTTITGFAEDPEEEEEHGQDD